MKIRSSHFGQNVLYCFHCILQWHFSLKNVMRTTLENAVNVFINSVRKPLVLPCLKCSYLCKYPTATAAKSLQSCPTLCNPIDGSLPGAPVPGILQARTLEWVAISFSNAWKWKVKVKLLSHVQLFTTPWTAAYQAPLYMGFSRQEYWSGVPLPSPDGGHNNS